MRFYLTFSFLGFKVVKKWTMNLFKGSEDFRFWKVSDLFNEIEYDTFYPSGSAPARTYVTPKMHKFSSNDSFPKLRPIVSSIGTFNYNLAVSFVIFFHL